MFVPTVNGVRAWHRQKNIHKHVSFDEAFYQTAYKDYLRFMREVVLAATPRHQQLLAAQSVVGHAINGHKEFSSVTPDAINLERYPNTTILDIYDAILRHDQSFAPKGLAQLKAERQSMIRELKGWIDEVVKGQEKKYNKRRLLDSKGQPLMGIEYFRHRGQLKNPMSVILGIYLGSMLDSPIIREQAQDYFRSKFNRDDFSIHRGLCTAGNLEKMKEMGLSVEDLSKLASHSRWDGFTLEDLITQGTIVDFESRKLRKVGVPNNYPHVPVYVELASGYGVSDDAAFLYISMLYGEEAGLGFMLIDAVDTIDKCTEYIKEKGEDELIGDSIRSKLNKHRGVEDVLGLSDQDVLNMIYAAAIDKHDPDAWPSCSQRRFLQIDENGAYALWSHLNLVRCLSHDAVPPPKNITLGMTRVDSYLFYHIFRERLQSMLELDIIGVNNPRYVKFEEIVNKFSEITTF